MQLAGLEGLRPGAEPVPPDRSELAVAGALAGQVRAVPARRVGADGVAVMDAAAGRKGEARDDPGLEVECVLPDAATLLLREGDARVGRLVGCNVDHDRAR